MKMVTYFNRTDLVKFGQYLLSDERRKRFAKHPDTDNLPFTLEERLAMVHHADVENWLEDQRTTKPRRVTVDDLRKEGMKIDAGSEEAVKKALNDFYDDEANAKYEREHPEEIARTDRMLETLIKTYRGPH